MSISYTPMSVASMPSRAPPQTEPEVDLLGGRPRRRISAQFHHGLNGFYPLVHVRMEGVQKSAVVQEFPRDIVDAGSGCVGLSLSTVF